MPRKKETRGRKKTLTAKQYAKNQMENTANWQKENTRCINVRFNIENDNEINNYSSGMTFYTNRINYIFNILNKGKFKKDIELFGLSDQFKPLMKYETAETIDMSDILKLRVDIESDLERMGFEYNIDIKY